MAKEKTSPKTTANLRRIFPDHTNSTTTTTPEHHTTPPSTDTTRPPQPTELAAIRFAKAVPLHRVAATEVTISSPQQQPRPNGEQQQQQQQQQQQRPASAAGGVNSDASFEAFRLEVLREPCVVIVLAAAAACKRR